MSKKSYYFSHDMNARNDQKIVQMRSIYKAEGYGWYWMLIEMMREDENYELDLSGKYVWNAFALQMDTTAEKCKEFIMDCVNEFNLFQSDGIKFWSNSLKNRMALMEEKSEKARKSAQARWNKAKEEEEEAIDDANALDSDSERNAKKRNKTKINKNKKNEIKEKEIKEKEIKENKNISEEVDIDDFEF